MPRWGFPHVTWRPTTAVPGTPSNETRPMHRVRLLGKNATTVLGVLAGLALVTAGAELWRYVLLAQSRYAALSSGVVGASDALVLAGSMLTFAMALLALAASLWWLVVARSAAAEVAGVNAPRPTWQVAVSVLVPVLNLFMAGSVVAEFEHAVLRRAASNRPRPSWLVLGWWAAWAVNGVLLMLVIVWRMRDGIQAQADGVLLTALNDVAAAVLAVVTALVVRRMTELLAPIEPGSARQLRVRSVRGAPEPPLRTTRPAGARR